jgi:5'-methylthioadenosine phosphorylase/5'-methylthioinosine phosphorylase
MSHLAIIGGSGFAAMSKLEIVDSRPVETDYGQPSAHLIRGRLAGRELLFLPRHGAGHAIPPHRINYRANIQALYDAGAERIVALAAVGGISEDCGPLTLCIPDQIIDYTHGRESTFHDGLSGDGNADGHGDVVHVDFSYPYSARLRRQLSDAARDADLTIRDGGTYGVTQGPRLETVAEIARLQRDGCDLVGMTAMPEAVLARELGMRYATLAFVVNWAAGKSDGIIGMDEINANLDRCATDIYRLLISLAVQSPID